MRTDRTVRNNKPDIVIRDDKQGRFMLIDVAFPGDRNVVKKEAEKILKCEELITEIHRMWNVKAKAIPVIIGAIGTVSESLRQYLSNIPVEREIKELQNPDIMGTAHKLRKVLMWKHTTCLTHKITLHVALIVNTEQLQRCIA